MASGNLLVTRFPLDAELPSSNFPQQNVRNNRPVLDFDAATKETAYFTCVLPDNYGGGGLTIKYRWVAASATSGNAIMLGAIERYLVGTDNIDTDSFASDQTVTTAANGTNGVFVESVLTFTSGANMDSLAAGDTFRLRTARDAANGSDTMTGDLELVSVSISET